MRERAWLEAEALFAGLSKNKQTAEDSEQDPKKGRRRKGKRRDDASVGADGNPRRRIVGQAAPIRVMLDGSGTTGESPTVEPVDEVQARADVARAQLAGAIRDLGGAERGERLARRKEEEEEERRRAGRVRRIRAVEDLAVSPPAPDRNSFLVAVRAPAVDARSDIHFVVDGADVVDAAGDAMRGVEDYMKQEHPGCEWQMRSIEKIRDVLRGD